MSRKRRNAFTLVELLLVIGIIVLMISLLLPSLGKVRERSVETVCRSYLHMYGFAGQQFLHDHQDSFPARPGEWLYREISDTKDHPIGCRWHDRAMSYQSDLMAAHPEYQGLMIDYVSRVGCCPTFSRYAQRRGCENPHHNPDIDIEPQFSYSINGYLGSTQPGGVRQAAEVRDPSSVFFFGEENSWTLRPDHPQYPVRWLSAPLSTTVLDDTVLLITPTPQAQDCFATYHGSSDLDSGSGNVVFLDGHVDSINAEEQLREKMHGASGSKSGFLSSSKRGYKISSAGNLWWAWASLTPPPGGWDQQ